MVTMYTHTSNGTNGHNGVNGKTDRLILDAVYTRAGVAEDTKSRTDYLKAATTLTFAQTQQVIIRSLRRSPDEALRLLEGIVVDSLKEDMSDRQICAVELLAEYGTDVHARPVLERLAQYVVSGNLRYDTRIKNPIEDLRKRLDKLSPQAQYSH
ncbi:hypothetical protein ACFL3V_00240 [Nanoarchaeota archaeon]